jgi:hypothetical protein
MNFVQFNLGRILLWVVIICAPGCTVEEKFDYLYLQLESPALEVSEWGVVNLDRQVLRFVDHKLMPIAYRLPRENYVIQGRIPLDETRAEVDFTAKDLGGDELYVGGVHHDACVGGSRDAGGVSMSDNEPDLMLTFEVARRGIKRCYSRDISPGVELLFDVVVWDRNGLKLGEEALVVRVKKNGYFFVTEGFWP